VRGGEASFSRGQAIAEVLSFFWARGPWWLVPFVGALLVSTPVIFMGEATGLMPFRPGRRRGAEPWESDRALVPTDRYTTW